MISNPHQEHNKLSYDFKGKNLIPMKIFREKSRCIMGGRFSRFYEVFLLCLLFSFFFLFVDLYLGNPLMTRVRVKTIIFNFS